jgi:hypothetical protein
VCVLGSDSYLHTTKATLPQTVAAVTWFPPGLQDSVLQLLSSTRMSSNMVPGILQPATSLLLAQFLGWWCASGISGRTCFLMKSYGALCPARANFGPLVPRPAAIECSCLNCTADMRPCVPCVPEPEQFVVWYMQAAANSICHFCWGVQPAGLGYRCRHADTSGYSMP